MHGFICLKMQALVENKFTQKYFPEIQAQCSLMLCSSSMSFTGLRNYPGNLIRTDVAVGCLKSLQTAAGQNEACCQGLILEKTLVFFFIFIKL